MNMRSNQTSRNFLIIGIIVVVVIGLIAFFGRNFFARQFSRITTHIHFSRTEKQATLPPETEAYIRTLEAENLHLKELLHIEVGVDASLSARIIAWPSDSLDGTFIVSAGEKEGVRQNDMVFVSNTLVGIISRVFSTRSIVSPIGAGEESAIVTFAGREGVYHAKQTGFGSFLVQVPKDVSVIEGDAVAMPYYDGRAIGVVVSVDADNPSSFTHVYISIPVSIHDARFVQITPAVVAQ